MAVELGLTDTSYWIALETGRDLDDARVPSGLLVSIITVGELRAGVLAAADTESRSARLTTLGEATKRRPVVIDDSVAEAWATLRGRLRDAGRRMPVNDSWIAATAIALGVPVVTQDDDYDGAPGVDVIKM